AGALRAQDDHVALLTLRSADEVIAPTDLEAPPGRPPTEKELKLARELVASLEDTFDPRRYRAEHRARVVEFVEGKAKGRKIARRERDGRGRAFWSGTLSFGLVSVPVALFPANRAGGAPLRMLAPDGTPLARRYVCTRDGRALDDEQIVRGYEI